MAHNIFREQLAIKFPAYGHPLWEPSPGSLYRRAAQVGDVGYIREGRFQRLFNILLPADDPSHENFGVPDYHEPFKPNVPNHIDLGILRPNDFCSAGVHLESDGLAVFAKGPESSAEISFSCRGKTGAVLSLPIPAKREDTVLLGDFGKWITKHIDRWFAWTRRLGLGIDRMEDIILVTGIHRTRSWTNVAFPEGQADARASFGVEVATCDNSVTINWQFSRERNRGAVLNWGPNGKDLPEDQCIFIRGFRVTRKLMILPRLRGAAGPNPDQNDDDCESDTELISISALPKYRDPLHILLQYIAEAAPNCDMALVHDDDLALIGRLSYDTPREGLQPDVELSCLRSSKPFIYEVLFGPDDLLPDNNSSVAQADTEIVRVATLSAIYETQLDRRIRGRMISPNTTYVVPSRVEERPHPEVHHPLSWRSSTSAQPQSLRGVTLGHETHDALASQSSPRNGKRKALLIGVNYSAHLNPNINRDVYDIAYFLHGLGFERNSMRVLTDDQPLNLPTKKNILAAMYWLAEGAQSGDSLFFYFSGPAAQIHGNVSDGLDETLCTMDDMANVQFRSGLTNPRGITDNNVHDIMIKPLPSNCRLTAVLDCCHSGTLLDLPFIYDSHGMVKPNHPSVIKRRTSDADVISLSACKDHHDGGFSEELHGGAMRGTFKECMTSSGYRLSCVDIIRSLCDGMHANGFRQQPQLSSSRPIDISRMFII